MKVSRRDFVKTVGASAACVSFCGAVWKARILEPAKDIENPLARYPDPCSPPDLSDFSLKAMEYARIFCRIVQSLQCGIDDLSALL